MGGRVLCLTLLLLTLGSLAQHASRESRSARAQEPGVLVEGAVFIDLDADGQKGSEEPFASGVVIEPPRPTRTGYQRPASTNSRDGMIRNRLPRLPVPSSVVLASDLIYDGEWRAPLEAVVELPTDPESRPVSVPLTPRTVPRDERYFERTGFRVEHGYIWDYYLRRGGEAVFGAPVSGLFSTTWVLNGNCCWMQLFERGALQVVPSVNIAGRLVESVNLFDVPHGFPALVGADPRHGLYPPIDPALKDLAPSSAAPDFPAAFDTSLDGLVPDDWAGLPVGFRRLYFETATAVAADEGPGIRALVALELWGYPLSRPAADPEHPGMVYQRFQHAIMRYRADCGCAERVPLGMLMRDVLRDRDLDPAFRELQLRTQHPLVGVFRAELLQQEVVDVNMAVSVLAMEPR